MVVAQINPTVQMDFNTFFGTLWLIIGIVMLFATSMYDQAIGILFILVALIYFVRPPFIL